MKIPKRAGVVFPNGALSKNLRERPLAGSCDRLPYVPWQLAFSTHDQICLYRFLVIQKRSISNTTSQPNEEVYFFMFRKLTSQVSAADTAAASYRPATLMWRRNHLDGATF